MNSTANNGTANALTYRPRNAGHDYYGRGTYLVTLVVSEAKLVFLLSI